MEIKTETNTTNTVVENATITTFNIPSCIFILFAEYLGYETPLIEWCEEWCNDAKFPEWKKNVLKVDAKLLYTEMQKEFSQDKIIEYYRKFYDLVICNWCDKLSSVCGKESLLDSNNEALIKTNNFVII